MNQPSLYLVCPPFAAAFRPQALWPVALPAFMGFVAVYLLLPRAHGFPRLWGGLAAAGFLILGGWLLLWPTGILPETLLFLAFSAIAVIAGGMLITQQNPVHAALSFALVVLSTCGLFLLQAAPFLMAATIIVYAGAIVVTFLFVIMLAQQAGISDADHRAREPLLSCLAGFVLLVVLVYVLQTTYDVRPLTALLQKTEDAAGKDSLTDIAAALVDDGQFFDQFQREAEAVRGSSNRSVLITRLIDIRANWADWKRENNVAEMKEALSRLADQGNQVRATVGSLEPHELTSRQMSSFSVPASDPGTSEENVAPLGRMLFTDYLIAVELAGAILLAATIGAIAIAGRKSEGLR